MVLVHRKAASSVITPTSFDYRELSLPGLMRPTNDATGETATSPLSAAAPRSPGFIKTSFPPSGSSASPPGSPLSASTHDPEASILDHQDNQADISDVVTLLTLAVAALSAVPISVAVTVENAHQYPILWAIAYISGTTALALSFVFLVVALAYPGVYARRLSRRTLTPLVALLAFLLMTSFTFLTLVCQPWILGAPTVDIM